MDYLIISPPAHPPSEPPSGAFILTAALCGHGYDAAFFDLSLEFYHRHFRSAPPDSGVDRALDYMIGSDAGYAPMVHRTHAGILARDLRRFSTIHPGWKLTAMNATPPGIPHDPVALTVELTRHDPFFSLWEDCLLPALARHRPKQVLISLAYLSQLPATLSLVPFLKQRGIVPVVGGSLPRSLNATGYGFAALAEIIGPLDAGDGEGLVATGAREGILSRLQFPRMISRRTYLSSRPILPLTLSTGCHWNKCLFCPDRQLPFRRLGMKPLDQFLSSIPSRIATRRPVIHLLDSAMPPGELERFFPLATSHRVSFYGFARPSRALGKPEFLQRAADSGCRMLQLGVESGSASLLNRFVKGVDPTESTRVILNAAAAGIRTYVYLLFGLPGETANDRELTRQLLSDCTDGIDFLNLSIFNLPRYSELTQRADEYAMSTGRYRKSDSSIEMYLPFTVNGVDPRTDARHFISNIVTADSAVRGPYLQTPKWFRAAHNALMCLPNRYR